MLAHPISHAPEESASGVRDELLALSLHGWTANPSRRRTPAQTILFSCRQARPSQIICKFDRPGKVLPGSDLAARPAKPTSTQITPSHRSPRSKPLEPMRAFSQNVADGQQAPSRCVPQRSSERCARAPLALQRLELAGTPCYGKRDAYSDSVTFHRVALNIQTNPRGLVSSAPASAG